MPKISLKFSNKVQFSEMATLATTTKEWKWTKTQQRRVLWCTSFIFGAIVFRIQCSGLSRCPSLSLLGAVGALSLYKSAYLCFCWWESAQRCSKSSPCPSWSGPSRPPLCSPTSPRTQRFFFSVHLITNHIIYNIILMSFHCLQGHSSLILD